MLQWKKRLQEVKHIIKHIMLHFLEQEEQSLSFCASNEQVQHLLTSLDCILSFYIQI